MVIDKWTGKDMEGIVHGSFQQYSTVQYSFDSSVDGLRKIMGYFSRNKFLNFDGISAPRVSNTFPVLLIFIPLCFITKYFFCQFNDWVVTYSEAKLIIVHILLFNIQCTVFQ